MLEVRENIKSQIENILKEWGVSKEVVVEDTASLDKGDLTTNIAMQLSKELGRAPRDIAQDIVSRLELGDSFEKVEVAGPGFINLYYSNSSLLEMVNRTNEQGADSTARLVKSGKKLVIEYTDPNPFKIFHIGHLYTNMVGESFARLQEALGADVKRAIYQGDVGLHVAKTMWGLVNMLKEEGLEFNDLESRSLSERVGYLGDAYMLGFKYYDDIKDPKALEEIRDINYYIFSLYIPSLEKKEYFKNLENIGIKEMFLKGRDWCMEYFENIYMRTGSKFEYYFLESEMSEKGLDAVLSNTDPNGKKVFKRDGDSVIYEGDTSKGLHTRVFVNKEGLPTYEAKEIGLAISKSEKISYDESVIITADEQTGYFKVVLDAFSQLEPEAAKLTKHMPHGMVKLPGAEKMSSRKGKILGGEWLLEETKSKVKSIMSESGKYGSDEIEVVSEKIAVGAIKYAFLKVSVGKDVIFDFDKSISFDGDTGPYLQYVYARCRSILNGQKVSTVGEFEMDIYTKDLLRYVSRLDSVLLESGLNYSPSNLCTYLFELGQMFNTFYQNVRVLDSESKEELLAVVSVVALTMQKGLEVLGIEVVDKM